MNKLLSKTRKNYKLSTSYSEIMPSMYMGEESKWESEVFSMELSDPGESILKILSEDTVARNEDEFQEK